MRRTAAPVRWLGAQESGLTQPKPIVDIGVSRNGRFVVTSDPQCVFRVFDLQTGQGTAEAKVPAKLKAKFDRLRNLSISDDGRRVVGQLEKWVISGDVTQWQPRARASSAYLGRARALPDARYWTHLYGGLEVYDGDTTDEQDDPQRRGVDLDVAANGRIVAMLHDEGGPGALRIFSPALKLQASIDVDDVLHAGRVAFVDDDQVVVIADHGRAHWWDVAKGKLRSSEVEVEMELSQARLLGPLRVIVTGHGAETAQRRVIELSTGEIVSTTPIDLWAVSADGSVLVAARGASVVRCDPTTFEEIEAAPHLRTNVRGLGFEPAADFIWSADDEHAHRWSLRDGRVDATLALPSTKDGTLVAGDASALVVRESYKSAVRLMLPSGRRSGTSDGSWRELPVSFDGSRFARTTGMSMQIKAWDGEVAAEWPSSLRVSAAAFDPDGELFVTCYRGGRVDIRKTATGALVAELESGAPRTFSIAVSPGARWLAICSDSPKVYVVDVARRKLAHVLRLAKRTTGPVALSADGRWIAASDQVSTLVWSLATGEKQHAVKAGARSLAFSPDSTKLAIGGAGTLGILALE
jgi:hypothetical protein